MEKLLTEQKLNSIVKNGAYINIHFARSCETYKKLGDLHITKDTEAIVRLGVTYSHIQDERVQSRVEAARMAAIERGESEQVDRKLPWGQWVAGSKYLIEHNGKYYLRCTLSRSPKHHAKVTYMQDGNIVEYTQIENYLTAKEKSTNDDVIFVVPLENIISLGNN